MSAAWIPIVFVNIVKSTCRIQHFTRFISSSTIMSSKKNAILLLADGAEEMEAVITADILRRGGVAVTIASVADKICVKCSREVNISADTMFDTVKDQKFDAVILPGGLGGSKALASSTDVGKLLKEQESENRLIAAICAAPTALRAHGIAKGKKVTSYPSMKDQLIGDYKYIDDDIVVTDGNLITSKGPATAFAFGLAIVEKLVNKETAKTVANAMLYKDYK